VEPPVLVIGDAVCIVILLAASKNQTHRAGQTAVGLFLFGFG
jgi:hypothetical protein